MKRYFNQLVAITLLVSPAKPQIVRPDPATKPTHMSEMIALAENRLLRPGGLAASDLDRVFARLMSPAVDSADLYFEHSRSESWMLEDGLVKEGSHSIEQGVGIRAQSGEKTGFAYSDDIVKQLASDIERELKWLIAANAALTFISHPDKSVEPGLSLFHVISMRSKRFFSGL